MSCRFRLHRALLAERIESRMRVAVSHSELSSIVRLKDKIKIGWGMVRPSIGGSLMMLQRSPNTAPHSPALLPSGLVPELNRCSADIINLHWVCGETITIEEIGRIRSPLSGPCTICGLFAGPNTMCQTELVPAGGRGI